MLRVLYAVLTQFREIFPRIEELEGGTWRTALSDDVPLGHGTRGGGLHHKAAGHNDDEAAQG